MGIGINVLGVQKEIPETCTAFSIAVFISGNEAMDVK